MIQFLVALALCYVLIKIPFWVFKSIRGGGGRSVVGGLIRGLIAYKTFGLAGRAAKSFASPALRRPWRKSTGEDGAAEQAGGSRGFSALNPVAAFRRRHQRRWSDPEGGMLPMKLRRPKRAYEIGTQRPSLGEEFDDPERVMPWQRESPSYTPGLLNPRGRINPSARRERNPRKVEHAERGMLNVNLRHNSRGVGLGVTPTRPRLSEDFDDPQRQPPVAEPKTSRALLAEDGTLEPRAQARKPVPEPISPEPGMLPMTLWPKRPPPPAPAEPAEPRAPRPQQALMNKRGAVTQNARARRPRRRATRQAGSARQHQSPQTHQPERQRGEGSDRG